MPSHPHPLSTAFYSLLLDEDLLQFLTSKVQQEKKQSLENHLSLNNTARRVVKAGRELRNEMLAREKSLLSRQKELETLLLKIPGEEDSTVSNLRGLLAKLQDEKKLSELNLREQLRQMGREISLLRTEAEREKAKLGQDLREEFKREREQIQEEAKKHRNEEKAAMDATLEEVRRIARKELDEAKTDHSTREGELLDQLGRARELAMVVETNLQVQLRKEQELLDQVEKARDQTKSVENKLQQQQQKEQELLDQLEKARGEAKTTEAQLHEKLRSEQKLLSQTREQAMSTEATLQKQLRKELELLVHLDQAHEKIQVTEIKLQEQLRKEQEEREQEKERLRVAMGEENARVRHEFYNGFFEHFTKEKAQLMEGLRKDIQEMREDIKKEGNMWLGEQREEDIVRLDEQGLEEQESRIVGEEGGSNVARD